MIGRKLLRSSLSSETFLIFGSTRPSLKASGKTSFCSDRFTRFVIAGSSTCRQDFKVRVGIVSEGHDFEGDFSMISRTASVVTSSNFVNEQLQGCIMLAVGVCVEQFSVDCLKFAILLTK